ncbi:MAG: oxidoreductase [Sandaracinaceae bacterium]
MKWTREDMPNLSGTVAVVTGANSGIGFETALAFALKGAKVVIACRSPERGEAARAKIAAEAGDERVELRALDLGSLQSIERFADELLTAYPAIDRLVNNAGVMIPPKGETTDGFELQLGTNHYGHFALTGRLWPALAAAKGARVTVVASTAHRWGKIAFDDLDWRKRRYFRWLAYGQSKLANLLFARELAARVARANAHVLVASSHPGYTATNLTRHSTGISTVGPAFGMSAWRGALPSLYAATASDVKPDDYFGPHLPGEMWGWPKRVGRSGRARDAEVARKLWERSEEATGVAFGDAIG